METKHIIHVVNNFMESKYSLYICSADNLKECSPDEMVTVKALLLDQNIKLEDIHEDDISVISLMFTAQDYKDAVACLLDMVSDKLTSRLSGQEIATSLYARINNTIGDIDARYKH